MGKSRVQQQRVVQGTESTILCPRCSVAISRIAHQFSLKCVVVVIFGLSVFLSSLFWVLPLRSAPLGFDAKDAIKLRSSIQAHFILQKPVSKLVKHIARLEHDIYIEIAVPSTKVAILSVHQFGASNCAHVVFGVISETTGSLISSVSLSVLRMSLAELFLQQTKLTLTTSIFGEPSCFEILKFPGGITIIPEQYSSFWQVPPILFNFTVNNSALEIKDNFPELKERLKFGLHLRSDENVFVQITSSDGSTVERPVTAQVSVTSVFGSLSRQRLRQLGQKILGSSPPENLGLNNSIFSRVKGISLSSFLNNTLHAAAPSPSPAPAAELDDCCGLYPAHSPDYHAPNYPP